MHPQGIGKSVLRREDNRMLLGKGQYVADLLPENTYYCAFLRSPHAHALIQGIDIEVAKNSPGVVSVLTGQDMLKDGIGKMTPLWMIPGADGSQMNEPPRYSITPDRVRHVGEIVALVVARTVNQAIDAIELIEVDYEVLNAVVDVKQAAQNNAPQLHQEAPNNLCVRFHRGSSAPVDAAFVKATHTIEVDIINHRIICAALEPRAVLAQPSPSCGDDGHELTLWSATQVPHHIRKLTSEQLNIPENSIRVIAPDVGGGFGTKGKLYPEETILAWACKKLNLTLKWTSTRSEAFISDYQARDHSTHAEMALDSDGFILGVRVNTYAAVGAYISTVGAAVPTTVYTAVLSGPYKIPAVFAEVHAMFTNTVPTDAYRGAGRPEACFVLERLIEQAAIQTGMDRMELRRKNFIKTSDMPYATPLGPIYDSGDFQRLFDRALVVADYANFEERRKLSREKGLIRGFGICYFLESSGVAPSKYAGMFGARAGFFDSADIRVAADGSILLMCGTHSHGQAHATTFPQVIASKIGLPLSMIELVEGDTGRVPYGTGTFGSRSMVVAGGAISMACTKILNKAILLAAYILKTEVSDVRHQIIDGLGFFVSQKMQHKLSWYDVARAITYAHDLPEGMEPVLHENAFFDPPNLTWSNGAQACEVEIDPKSGVTKLLSYIAIDDVGSVINPMVVEGQVHGAIAQGIGQALFESAVYDRETGQIMTGSFMDYAMPRADILPDFFSEVDETQPCTHNPLGVKGCGESGTIGAPAAITSAMIDALGSVGVSGVEMPFTSNKIWNAIQKVH
jgi:carbon-monoxide dehydrogenase large subunit